MILSKPCMNHNIIKTQLFHNMNFDLKGHLRLHEVIFVLKKDRAKGMPFDHDFENSYPFSLPFLKKEGRRKGE